MQIWVDADACPQVIKEILFRAAERARVLTTLLANTPLRSPPSDFRERLAIRNLMQELRSTGALIDGPAPFGQRERQLFANHLDRFLTRHRHA